MISDRNSLDAHGADRPAMMTAAVQSRYGRPDAVLHLERIEVPRVGPDDVLVRVMATTVNTPDWATVTGTPAVLRLQSGLRRPKQPVRGTDVAGVVEAVGSEVTEFERGDRVLGSTSGERVGTFAELTVTASTKLAHLPEAVSFGDAAASVMSGITALAAVRDAGEVGAGARVLVNGASGGVGTFAVQLAKAAGAHVTAVCSVANAELVSDLGADAVIDYTVDSFVDRDERYDVVLDNVMNHSPRSVARVLARDGVFLPNSIGSGGWLLGGLPRMARAMFLGLGSTEVRATRFEPSREHLREMAALLRDGTVRAVVDSRDPLERAADAVERMLTHRARGNVVVVPQASID